jgi:hypothetical protein
LYRVWDAAPSGMLRGEWWMHSIRMFKSAAGRAQDQRFRNGIESWTRTHPACASCASSAHRRIFDFAAFRTGRAGGAAKRWRAGSSAAATSAAGVRNGSGPSSDAVGEGSVRPIAATGYSARDANVEKPPDVCAVGSVSGDFWRAQFLRRVYTKGGFATLLDGADVLLRRGGELGLGDRGNLHRQQGLRRSGVYVKAEGR